MRIFASLIDPAQPDLTVVGVAREGFSGAELGASPDIFVPVMMIRQVNRSTWPKWNSRHMWWLIVMGRLKPGVSTQQATAELDVLYDRIDKADPEYRPAPAWNKKARWNGARPSYP